MEAGAADPTEPLRFLARELAEHYFRIGVPKRDHKKLCLPAHRRTIAVVGAGASRDADLPLAKEAIELVKVALRRPRSDREDELDQRLAAELRRLESVYRLNRDDFETTLLALGAIGYMSDRLREILKQLYSAGGCALLQYEMLAHLLKHRFLDAIINFNFDELLDRAIEDELRRGEYRFVLSDGDCPRRLEGEIAQPLYIKPHGTVSHPSTMRFTREAYYGLPLGIRTLLEQLLSQQPVTIWVVGFNMQSMEFNLLLQGVRRHSDIIHFNLSEPRPDPPLPSAAGQSCFTVRAGDAAVGAPGSETRPTLAEACVMLWSEVVKQLALCEQAPPAAGGNAEKQLPGIPIATAVRRHQIVARLFPWTSGGDLESRLASSVLPPPPAAPASTVPESAARDGERNKLRREIRYLHDRCAVELAVTIAKSKGLLSLAVLSGDRCGEYYNRMRQCAEKLKELDPDSATETPPPVAASEQGGDARGDLPTATRLAAPADLTLFEMCEKLGMTKKSYGREILRLEAAMESLSAQQPARPPGQLRIVDQEAFEKESDLLAKKLAELLADDETRNRLRSNWGDDADPKTFAQVLMSLYGDLDVEIRDDPLRLRETVLTDARAIPTLLDLRRQTEWLLEREGWNLLLVSAETAQWLLDPRIREAISKRVTEPKHLVLVAADATHRKSLLDAYGDRLEFLPPMNWWEHNHHMTIAASVGGLQSKETVRPLGTIYFERRRRTAHMTPLLIGQEGSQAPLEIFAAYCTKAELGGGGGRPLDDNEFDPRVVLGRILRS